MLVEMSFRSIRQSSGDGNLSASTKDIGQSVPESPGSDPRRNRDDKDGGEASTSTSKRRRVPESVTRNACLNCKKARAKCDGKKPCRRCASRVEESECVYEVYIKHAKEELVKQIKDFKAKDHLTEKILSALSSTEQEKVPEIIQRLHKGDSYESIVEWMGHFPHEDLDTMSPQTSHHSTVDTVDLETAGTSSARKNWTSVRCEREIFDHLFQLYFAWVHPVHTLFSEGHFVDSYQKGESIFCSESLVNAICALACHYHKVNDVASVENDLDFELLGVQFSDAAVASIDPEDRSVTNIQAFAVMFLVDCARSKGLRATFYLKEATENLSTVDFKAYSTNGGFPEVWRNTIRGVQNLNVEWAQMTCQVPTVVDHVCFDRVEEVDEKLDATTWYLYRCREEQPRRFPSLLAMTNREKSKLIAIVAEVTTMLYGSRTLLITARHVLEFYRRFIAWRDGLPDALNDLGSVEMPALPHVLSLWILYSNSVAQLLRPILELDDSIHSSIQTVIWNHAQRGLSILDEKYRAQYTCRYQPVLQMFSVLHLIDVVARRFPNGFTATGMVGPGKDGPEAIYLGMIALMQSRVGFPVAGPLQEMLRRTAIETNIRIATNLTQMMLLPLHPKQSFRMGHLIDACTRSSYVQPFQKIMTRFHPSLAAEWAAESSSFKFLESVSGPQHKVLSAEERGAQNLVDMSGMSIRNLLNST